MAVGYLNTPTSQSDISTIHLNVRRERRNGLADIFCGKSNEEINYLKGRFIQMYDSCSSVSDLESGCESDTEIEPVDQVFEPSQELCENCVGCELESESCEISCEEEMTYHKCEMFATRRLALADIFEGVPEGEVNDFLARHSDNNRGDICEQERISISRRKRRFAMGDIFEGISEERVSELSDFLLPEDIGDIDSGTGEDEEYVSRRRNALADIFKDVKVELVQVLGQYTGEDDRILCVSNSESDCVESDCVESDSEKVDVRPDSTPIPDIDYLWRRRCALANIFEGTGGLETPIRAQ